MRTAQPALIAFCCVVVGRAGITAVADGYFPKTI
jgi:hypothetical protein